MSGQYPNAFYRTSVKGFIYDENGNVLVVQEKGDKWSLPGGGMDHGETPLDALKRELMEELGITSDFSAKFIGIDTYFYKEKDAWLLLIMYELKFDGQYVFGLTDDVQAVEFVSPRYFEDKSPPYQQVINKWIKKSPH